MPNIPLDMIDVDYPAMPWFVPGDLGVAVFDQPDYRAYGDEIEVIPESQWRELAEQMKTDGGGCSALVVWLGSQLRESSCVSWACCKAHEIIQAKQFGKENVVKLSPISLYQRIARSEHSGAMVSNGLKKMAEGGVLPRDDAENRAKFGEHVFPVNGWGVRYPDGWETTGKKFRATEWFVIDRVNELFTALFNRHPVVVGRSGHSIAYCDPIFEDGRWLVKYADSYNVYRYDSMNMIRSAANWAFALRSVTVSE